MTRHELWIRERSLAALGMTRDELWLRERSLARLVMSPADSYCRLNVFVMSRPPKAGPRQ